MLQVLVLLQSATTKKASVISELKIINNGTGDYTYGNYDVELIPENRERVRVQVTGFRRDLGCEALIMEALMEINEKDLLDAAPNMTELRTMIGQVAEPPYAPTV